MRQEVTASTPHASGSCCADCGAPIADEDRARFNPRVKKAWRRSASENGLQSYCAECHQKRNDANRKDAPDQREKDADPAERAWVLALQHERGKPHDATHCPRCQEQN